MNDEPDISRRQLLRGNFFGGLLRKAGESLHARLEPLAHLQEELSSDTPKTPRARVSFPILRPPGAIEEGAFLDGCTRCDACVEACPHDAIVHAPLRFRDAAGTPMIDPSPNGQPCWMCEDFPCIAACEPNVLRMDMPKRMGEARIDVHTCLAHIGSFCTVCSEQCPVEGAIEVTNGKPRIITEVCTGCGVCHHVCPAPANAVLQMPTFERPTPPRTEASDHE